MACATSTPVPNPSTKIRLGSVLIRAAEMHETQTRQRIDRLLALINPLVTIAIDGLIVSVMGAILGVGQLAR